MADSRCPRPLCLDRRVALIRLKQTLVVLVGIVLAGSMVVLGVWQLDVYRDSGEAASARRAAEQPLPLTQAAPAGAAVTDGYGRSVFFDGTYDPTLQLLVPVADTPGQFRVLTAARQSDGSVVPVVRGLVNTPTAPAPPTGPVHQTGVLLASEDTPESPVPTGQLGSVRIPALAQTWPGPLIGGFVTLSAPEARGQQLEPATVALPKSSGRLRNAAYAFQWWLFSAFALAMSIRVARDVGRAEALESEITAEATADPT